MIIQKILIGPEYFLQEEIKSKSGSIRFSAVSIEKLEAAPEVLEAPPCYPRELKEVFSLLFPTNVGP